MNFYISDYHFGHSNIIRYDNRMFKNVNQMDEVMIEKWNNVVTNNDTVYILGDFSWYKEDKTIDILNCLSGRKVLIRGNHDKISTNIAAQYDGIYDYLEITDGTEKVVLSHYPILFWNGQFHDSIHLYGHVHNSHQWNCCESYKTELKQLQALPMRMYNVGCMMEWMDYTPRTLKEILSRGE